MTRREWPLRQLLQVILLVIACGIGVPAAAQDDRVLPQIVMQLDDQGFSIDRVRRTWLGRVQVIATSAEYRREIVYVPATGEVLRDYWTDLSSSAVRDDDRDRREDADTADDDVDVDDDDSDDDDVDDDDSSDDVSDDSDDEADDD